MHSPPPPGPRPPSRCEVDVQKQNSEEQVQREELAQELCLLGEITFCKLEFINPSNFSISVMPRPFVIKSAGFSVPATFFKTSYACQA